MPTETHTPSSTDRIVKRLEVNALRSRVWRALARAGSTGMAWAFVQSLRREYLDGAELTGPAVPRALPT